MPFPASWMLAAHAFYALRQPETVQAAFGDRQNTDAWATSAHPTLLATRASHALRQPEKTAPRIFCIRGGVCFPRFRLP